MTTTRMIALAEEAGVDTGPVLAAREQYRRAEESFAVAKRELDSAHNAYCLAAADLQRSLVAPV